MKKLQRGFTLIELLVVIGILAILLAITLIAINPSKQFSQANNTKRRSDVNAILNAVNQYMADNKGAVPAAITSTPTVIGNATGQVDICDLLVPQYIASLPVDPLTNDGAPVSVCATVGHTTGYEISQSATNNRITVAAPDAENSEVITVTR